MKKIVSLLMIFVFIFNFVGQSFGSVKKNEEFEVDGVKVQILKDNQNEKMVRAVDETNIYESHLNKKTQKLSIKVTDASSKKLVYADSIDLSNIDEEKVLKDIQENQETEQENLEILETEDDELKDVDHYILEAHKTRIKENKTYKSIFAGISYRVEKKLDDIYWTIGKKDDLFGKWHYFTLIQDHETNSDLLGYKLGVDNARQVESNMMMVLGATSFYAIAQSMPKIGFWGIFNTGLVASFIGATVIASLIVSALKFLSDIEYHRHSVHFNYSALEEIYWKKYMEQIKYPQSGS